MALEILMPALSPTMEEGTLAKWLVKEGDSVASGDLLAEIETDKATMEFEAVDDGVISKLLVEAGTAGVKVNAPIALLLEDGAAQEETEVAKTPIAETSVIAPSLSPNRVFASPLARRIAADRGLDLGSLKGSGPKGRIVKADVLGEPKQTSAIKAPAPLAPPPSPLASSDAVAALYEGRVFEEIPLDGMRKTIAARLTEAKQTIPHFYLRRDVLLDELLAFRAQIKKKLAKRDIKLSVNDFIIKACALALQDVPAANAVWAGDRVLQMSASDVAVAVAVDGGLFTPVLLDADSKSMSALSTEMKDLASRAKERKLAPHEYQGGSFAISNLGMMGIENFDAVINPPHGAILAVGAGVKKPIVQDDGNLGVATIMSLTLSVDHRVIDGALGAQLLAEIKDNLENPAAMLA
ncbi:2-oxo acid dehydrogenase subunit E2 [Planktotalea sp.]|uniref:2-oxo acid dehydrogenase subunit E2 n=1 Tax=Planktotalea sp. TaxID=2029877 RepID=UPI003D6B3831